jgi:hypothetical protein
MRVFGPNALVNFRERMIPRFRRVVAQHWTFHLLVWHRTRVSHNN